MIKPIFWGQPVKTNVVRPGEWIVPQKSGKNPFADLSTTSLFSKIYDDYNWHHLMHPQNTQGITVVGGGGLVNGSEVNLIPNRGSVGGNYTQDTAGDYFTWVDGALNGVNNTGSQHLIFPSNFITDYNDTYVIAMDYDPARTSQALYRINTGLRLMFNSDSEIRVSTNLDTIDLPIPTIPKGFHVFFFVTRDLGTSIDFEFWRGSSGVAASTQLTAGSVFSINRFGNDGTGGSSIYERAYFMGIADGSFGSDDVQTLTDLLTEASTRAPITLLRGGGGIPAPTPTRLPSSPPPEENQRKQKKVVKKRKKRKVRKKVVRKKRSDKE